METYWKYVTHTYDAFYIRVKINHSYISVTVMYLSVSIGSNMKRFNCVRCIYDSVVLWVSKPSF